MSKSERFDFLYKNSSKDFGIGFILFYKDDKDKREVGFTASKKVGNAVKRNFAKRRLRALFLQTAPLMKNGSYVVVAKQDIIDLDFDKIKRAFAKSLKRVKALEEVEL